MRCRQVEAQLVEYVDDVLDRRERERIEAHLSGCLTCRVAADDAAAAAAALRGLGAVRPPASFAPRIRSAVRAQAPRALAPSLFGRDLRAAIGGVCLMLLFGALAGQYLGRSRPYVAPVSTRSVAVASVPAEPAAAALVAAASVPSAAGSHAPQAPCPSRVSHPRLGTANSLSAVTGAPPSRAALTPKPVETLRPERPTRPRPPLVSAPAVHMAALSDSSTGARLTEGSPEIGPRRLTLPVIEPAPAPIGAAAAAEVGGGGGAADAPVVSAAVGTAESEATFGFDDLFDESSVPRYADVS